jgi:predicted TIM-barrel fold metal-dependent hydrolase
MYGLFDRFPALVFVAVEIEAGWAAQMLERADWVWRRYRNLSHETLCAAPPSEVFREHVRLNFTRGGRPALLAHEAIGSNTLLWGTDFPHNASTWPESVAVLDNLVRGLPPELRKRVAHTNAMDLYWSS